MSVTFCSWHLHFHKLFKEMSFWSKKKIHPDSIRKTKWAPKASDG